MRAILFLVVVAACGDNLPGRARDAGVQDTQQLSGPCLEQPTDVPAAPTGALPCDLLPPGFVVTP